MPFKTYHEEHRKDGSVHFVCDICDWWSADKGNLEQHARQQHQGLLVAGEPTTEPDEDDEQPGNRPEVPPGQEEQPGNRPDVPPGQDKPDKPEDEDVPHPEHPMVDPEQPVPTPHAVGA